jgi:Family of unknown function (DUF5681)
MVFVKGQSGNPSGKPKTTFNGKSLTEMAREHTDKALNALVGILDDTEAPHSAKVSAAGTLLDRGWGKPPQALVVDVPDNESDTGQAAGLLDALDWIRATRPKAERTAH